MIRNYQQYKHMTNQVKIPNTETQSLLKDSASKFQNLFGTTKSIFGLAPKISSDQTKATSKNQFVNEQPQDWPNWKQAKTPLQISKVKQEPKEEITMKDVQRIPRGASICRSHCLYFEYYISEDGFTYFYMKSSNDFMGYRRIDQPYRDNTFCYRNYPILRVKSEVAERQLEEKKSNGQYELYKQERYKKVYQ